MNYWTLDTWQVHPEHEDAFITLWTELMEWTLQEVSGIAGATPLYRDAQQMHCFFCPTAWKSLDAIDAWRASKEYQNRIDRIRLLCTDMFVRTLVNVKKVSSVISS